MGVRTWLPADVTVLGSADPGPAPTAGIEGLVTAAHSTAPHGSLWPAWSICTALYSDPFQVSLLTRGPHPFAHLGPWTGHKSSSRASWILAAIKPNG